MRTLVRALLITGLLASPLVALADVPGAVTGITAAVQDGGVFVQWKTPAHPETVKNYRVYFSRQSILQNGGRYDDFASTKGTETGLLLTDFPSSPRLYFSVLAVGQDGQESQFFQGEASVSAGPQAGAMSSSSSAVSFFPPSATASSSSSSAGASDRTLSLVSAQSVSGTGFILTFSAPVKIPPAQADQAFAVTDGSGKLLSLQRLVVTGNTVAVLTVMEQRNMAYTVQASPLVVYGLSPTLDRIPLDPAGSTATFVAVDGSEGPSPAFTPPARPTPTPPSRGLTQSGPAPLLAFVLAGAIVGWKRMRRATV